MSASLSKAEVKKLVLEEIENYKREGIKFAIAGNAGYGKTSTLNVLFDVEMKTDPTQTATREVHEISMLIQNVKGIEVSSAQVHDINLTVFDLPGLGDGEYKNQIAEEYFQIYTKLLPQVDVVLWVLRADVRAFELEITYISRLLKIAPDLRSRIIVGVNFIDSIAPQNWDRMINNPSDEQLANLDNFILRVDELIHKQCELSTNITVPYSAKYAWGLETLFNRLVNATPDGKKWVFADLKPDYREAFLTRVHPKFREQVAKEYSPV